MALSKRVEVLFDPERYACLERIARERRKAVGELIREAVEQLVIQPSQREKKEAVERLISMNIPLGGASWEEMKEEIARSKIAGLEAP